MANEKLRFLMATYLTVILQLLITFYVLYWCRRNPRYSQATKQRFIVYFLISFGLVIFLATVPMPPVIQLIVFALIAVVIGAMLHQASTMLPRQVIEKAVIGTITIFTSMSVLGIVLHSMGVNLAWMGWILLAGLVGLLISSIIILIPHNTSPKIHKIITIIGLTLFSVYVMYHTNTILQRQYKHNFVQAAIDFYLDFINIFVRVMVLDAS